MHYSWIDAASIVLREGLEALLVVVALLAFLKQNGQADKQGWIWLGSALGLVASLAAAVGIQALFAAAALRTNRELLEGVTGLAAAAMLFGVSYWLHTRASAQAWQSYLREQTAAALDSGGLASLALLSGLAVFREGGETVLFFLGIAPAIARRDLLLGVGSGAALLAVIAVALLGLGVRIPLRPFFRFASLLIFYLGFKFVGSSLHALQVAGILPAHPSEWLPTLRSLGLYATWETTLAQLGLLAAGGLAWRQLATAADRHES